MLTNSTREDTSFNRPNIWVHRPLSLGGGFVKDYKSVAEDYRQIIRLLGGYWSSSWSLPGLSDASKVNFFKQRLGSHVVCKFGGLTVWEGLIWSMDLSQKGVTRRITMDDVRNRIKTEYIDISSKNHTETSWYSKSASLQRYGTIEEVLRLDKVEAATAEAYAQTVLTEVQRPLPYPVSFKQPKPIDEPVTLKVEAVGYVYTLNYQYLTISDSARDIDTSIALGLSTDSEFITTGSLTSNTIQVAPPDTETRLWDWLEEITEIGDGTNPYFIQVLNNRRLKYGPLSPYPVMVWDGSRLKTSGNKPINNSHYTIRPGVIRDYTWNNIPLPSDYFLTNQQDSIVTEIEAGEKYDLPLLKTTRYNDSDYMAALANANVDLMED